MIDYNDYRGMQDAFSRCDLANAAMPKSASGKFVDDVDTYNKTQQLLRCMDMEEAHGFLYGIDFDHLTQQIVQKVNDLFNLAIAKGFIDDPNAVDEPEETEDNEEVVSECNDSPMTAWTCLYSAMKDGEIKTGECYSNAKDPQSAKADAISKLTGLGLTAIEIIAVEAGDPAAIGASSVADSVIPVSDEQQDPVYPEDEIRVDEDSILAEYDGPSSQIRSKNYAKDNPYKTHRNHSDKKTSYYFIVSNADQLFDRDGRVDIYNDTHYVRVEGGNVHLTSALKYGEQAAFAEASKITDFDEMLKIAAKLKNRFSNQYKFIAIMKIDYAYGTLTMKNHHRGSLYDYYVKDKYAANGGYWRFDSDPENGIGRSTGNSVFSESDETEEDSSEDEESEENNEESFEEDNKEEVEEKPEETEEPTEDSSKELPNDEKIALFHDYLDVWKSILKSMNIESYSSMDLDQIAEFWNKMSTKWSSEKPDPRDFMGKDNKKKLENLKIKL